MTIDLSTLSRLLTLSISYIESKMTTPQKTYSSEPETYLSHGWEKCKKQPLVPLGAFASVISLTLKAFSRPARP